MRILYICGDQGIPAFGRKGASTHMREMIAALRELGHEICLAAADLSGDRRPEEDFRTVKLPSPKSRLLGHDGRYLLANYRSRAILRRAALDFKADAIYERSALYFDAGGVVARQLRLPRILEVNALLAEEQHTRLHFPKLAEKAEHRIIKNAPAVAAISSVMVRNLAALGCNPNNCRPFSMAVDPKRFRPVEEPNPARELLGWPRDSTILGYVGSMNVYHRPDWFMDLAEKLLRRGDQNLRFLIVGGSTTKVQRFRGRLLRWVEEGRVHFTGSVPQSDMSAWLCLMDAILIPGASPQSTPTKIFEAAALGRPVLMPGTEPINWLCGAQSPLLFRPNNYNAFEEKVREFLADRSTMAEATRTLKERILRDHTWEHHAREVVRWFEELKISSGAV